MMKGAGPCVALTFDDGPDATLTPQLLTVLEDKGVHASFFVIGSKAAELPNIVAREAQDGDDVGNHSWDHPALPKLTSQAALSELTRTDDIISQIIGHPPAYTRAPYGSMSPRIAALSARTYVAWSVDTIDWKDTDVESITRIATSRVTSGSIVLMHDIHPHTIDAVPEIIDGLQANGFQLVTLSELLSGHCGGTELAYGGGGGEGAPASVSVGQHVTAANAQPSKARPRTAEPHPSPREPARPSIWRFLFGSND
jgi:peptidoglycan/xylan/chitin deacetylase (PgdA/CDA1 family)